MRGKKEKIKKIYFFIFVVIILLKIFLIVSPGHVFDLRLFQKWGNFLIENSPLEIYQKTECNMPPFWVYLTWFFSRVNFLITQRSLTIISEILKLPAVLADIGIGLAIFWFLVKKGVKQKISFLASSCFLLNPFVIYNSSVWGQFDSIYTFFALLSFIFLVNKKIYWAGFFLALSFLTKLQGIIFVPIFFFFLFKNNPFKKAFFSFIIFLATIIIIVLPFLIGGTSPFFIFQKTWIVSSELSPYLSLNAFNFWWIIQSILSAPNLQYISDSVSLAGLISFKMAGLLLFSLFYLLVLIKIKKNIFFLASLVALMFFILPTAMHERYLFPFFAFFPMFWALKQKYLLFFFILSTTSFLNLVFANISRTNIIFSLLLGLSPFLSLINIIIFFLLFFSLFENNKKRKESSLVPTI